MKIIALNSAKNGKKSAVAMELAKNSDVVYVRPYTDAPVPINQESYEQDEYIHLNVKQLAHKMEREKVAVSIDVGDNRYVFFENQFIRGFVVLLLDDDSIKTVKSQYGEDVITVRVKSSTEEHSERSGNLRDGFFDIVFDYDTDDVHNLEAMIEWFAIE